MIKHTDLVYGCFQWFAASLYYHFTAQVIRAVRRFNEEITTSDLDTAREPQT